jgi:hypothetical protein
MQAIDLSIFSKKKVTPFGQFALLAGYIARNNYNRVLSANPKNAFQSFSCKHV